MAQAGEPAADYSFNGSASLQGCSGALFRYQGQSMDSKALVLTNGHCIGFLKAYEVIVNQPTDREVTFFNAAQTESSTYTASEIVYGTMHQTDMAVLRLNVTYQQIKDDADVDSLLLATERATVGEDLVIVSGYWEYTTACRLDGFVHSMLEGRYTWTDSLRFTQDCVTFGGTSGSPVISVTSGEIVGVNNTGYEGGAACSDNNPCEVSSDGTKTTIPDGSYGQQTYHLYDCIDANFESDLSRTGCELPVPRGVLQLTETELETTNECDGDGNVDAGETGLVAISVYNDGPVALTDTTLTITSTSDAVDFVAGSTVQVDNIPAFGTTVVEVAIAVADSLTGIQTLEFDVEVSDPGSAAPQVTSSSVIRVNYDDVPNSSTSDDVESNATTWTTATELAESTSAGWARQLTATTNTVWHARDLNEYGDQRLQSAPLEVGSAPFVVRFSHRYRFEASGPTEQRPQETFWDGGVVEVSTDDGATWVDASQYATMNYGGTLTDESGNPLALREAFVGESANWPEASNAEIDFGTQLANKTVLLRFRLGTDAASGDFGWEIDDVEIDGIDNLPFSSIAGDTCGDPVTDPDPDPPPSDSGGCSSGGSGTPVWLLGLFVIAMATRRRRRA